MYSLEALQSFQRDYIIITMKNHRFSKILSIFKSQILNISSRSVKRAQPIIEKSWLLRSDNKRGVANTNDLVWEYTMRDPDELTGTDDDDGSITAARCAVLHGQVKAKVSQWMDNWEDDYVGGIMEMREFTEAELATIEAEEIDEDIWPEGLVAFEIGQNPGKESLGPSFVQLDWKRALALVETRELGWEVFPEEHETLPIPLPVVDGDSW